MIIMIIIIICFALFILRTALIFFYKSFFQSRNGVTSKSISCPFFPLYIPSVNVFLLYAYMVVK